MTYRLLLKLMVAVATSILLFSSVAYAAYNTGGGSGGGTGTSTNGQLLINSANTVAGISIGSGLSTSTTGGITTLFVTGGGGIPATAIIEETGTPIIEETGSYIVGE